MGCPCRNKQRTQETSVNKQQSDPMASQRAYDANHTQSGQSNDQLTASSNS